MSSLTIFDRGPSPYFHGREEILQTFSDYLTLFRKEKRGTIFLIQDAPGAGKTALLDVLSSLAKEDLWDVAEIKVKDLHNPVSMAQSLGESYVIDKQYEASVGIHGLGGGYTRNVAGYSSVERLLKDVSPKNGLVLMLDEAQTLNFLKETPDTRILAGNTLGDIHNGKLGQPVMLLAAGLGTTEIAFNSVGISRFGRNCKVHLGPLDKESEHAVIDDWLTEYAKVEGDPTLWVDAIAEQTHGWPQHIVAYVDPAIKYIVGNNHQMTDEGLEYVLERGAKSRQEYYNSRAHDIDEDKRKALARSISDVLFGETTTRPDIMSGLMGSGLTHDEAGALFNQALEQGIIDKRDEGRYGIPIPSMQKWFLNEYCPERIEIPKEDVHVKVKRHSKDDGKATS